MSDSPFTVAIDGPAASGKGTIGRRLASMYGFAYLDTGSLYREVTARLLNFKGRAFTSEDAAKVAASLGSIVTSEQLLRSAVVSREVPRVAAIPEVRQALVEFQRSFARRPGGAVLDGRDIGTVICPEAEVKLFVTASDQVRAHRRWLELGGDEAEVLADLRARDARDTARAAAPLRPAPDALLLDTTELTIDAAVKKAVEAIEKRIGQGRG